MAFSDEVTTLQGKKHLESQFASLTEVTDQSPLTRYLRYKFSDKMTTMVDDKLRSKKYDLIYVAGIPLLPYVLKHSNLPIVVDLIDDDLILVFHKFQRERNLYCKIRYLKWWYMTWRFRRDFVPRFSNFILTSRIDANSIQRLCPHATIQVIPNGVDAQYFNNTASKEEKNFPTLCFTGNMSFEPNVDAMLYLCDKIYPIIKREYPDIKLTIIGKDPLPVLRELANFDRSITLTDYVDDVRPYFERATVYVSPMRMGSGIKNKILEAWAMSIPIVSTSTGCTGIDILPGENIIVQNDPNGFAHEVINLLKNTQKREKLANSGRTFVLENYSWTSMSNKLNSLFTDVLQENDKPDKQRVI